MKIGIWNISRPKDKKGIGIFNVLPFATFRFCSGRIIQFGVGWLFWCFSIHEDTEQGVQVDGK